MDSAMAFLMAAVEACGHLSHHIRALRIRVERMQAVLYS